MPPDLSSPNLTGIERFLFTPRVVEKPWGSEVVWAVSEHYAGKILFVRAGQSLSLQFHNVKDEAWYVLEGRARLELGRAGEGTVHRLSALEDTRIIEVSTPQLDDVVRLEDRYGREGTSAP